MSPVINVCRLSRWPPGQSSPCLLDRVQIQQVIFSRWMFYSSCGACLPKYAG